MARIETRSPFATVPGVDWKAPPLIGKLPLVIEIGTATLMPLTCRAALCTVEPGFALAISLSANASGKRIDGGRDLHRVAGFRFKKILANCRICQDHQSRGDCARGPGFFHGKICWARTVKL